MHNIISRRQHTGRSDRFFVHAKLDEKRTMKENDDNIREKLLEASIKLFLSKGYSGATTMEIAKLAGVSKGALYYYFRTKEDILSGVLDRYSNLFMEELIKKTDGCSGNFVKKFKMFYKFSAEFSRDNWELLLVFSALHVEFTGTGTDIERRMQEIITRYRIIIQKLIEDGIQDGTVAKEINPKVYSRLFVSTLMGSLFQWYVNRSTDERNPAVSALYGKTNRDALLKVVLSGDSSSTNDSNNKLGINVVRSREK